MIEELQIVREIFGDLSAVGIWAIVAYFTYKVLVIIGWLTGGYIVLRVLGRIYESIVAKTEQGRLDIDRYKNEAETAKTRAAEYRAESERVQHLYKLLKEAKPND